MTSLEFAITFHSPFQVSLGQGTTTTHDTVDRADRLPATSLKGVMRATAAQLLGETNPALLAVFGSGRAASPWRWSAAKPDTATWGPVQRTARVHIDPDTHTAVDKRLAFTEQTGATRATFTVSSFGRIEPDQLDTHTAVLVVAAQATRSLGKARRRGLGWVSMRCTTLTPDEQTVRRFLELNRHD